MINQNREDNRLTVIIPMAGDGTRFGCAFKPFLKIRNEYFIQAAIKPFLKWQDAINEFVFVYRKDQDEKYNVSIKLKDLFSDIKYKSVILPKNTSGPVETISSALLELQLIGHAIFCDCDHSINVDPLFDVIYSNNNYNCILPVWEIDKSEAYSWSVVAVDKRKKVVDIAEKYIPEMGGEYFGVIGCYYFKYANEIPNYYDRLKAVNFSDIIREFIKDGESIKVCKIEEAEFFGDPERLQNTLTINQ